VSYIDGGVSLVHHRLVWTWMIYIVMGEMSCLFSPSRFFSKHSWAFEKA
jgi:hypothetical protein